MEVPVALLLRLVAVFFPGYMHPDEFFQAPEVMAKLVFGRDTFIPWEYSCEEQGHLFRSVLPPFLTCGLPFSLMKSLGFAGSGYFMFLVPRFCLLLLSLGADSMFYSLFGQRAYYVYRTSWVTMVMMIRPFSNSLETYYLLFCIYFAKWCQPLRLGFFVACGLFARVTFPAFVLPIIFYTLYQSDQMVVVARGKGKRTMSRWNNLAKFIILFGTGFLLAAMIHILADSIYCMNRPECHGYFARMNSFRVVLTPLNNLLYNMSPSNLAQHGLHPRYLHVLVNMQLLFTPIWLYVLGAEPQVGETRMVGLMKVIAFSGLSILSLFPHQEPRFLFPLVIPIAVITSNAVTRSRKIRYLWKTFNVCMGLFYGVFHQGGLARSIMALDHKLIARDNVHCVATYETYMPPRYLLGPSKLDAFVDITAGNSLQEIQPQLKGCPKGESWFLILPRTALQDFPQLNTTTRTATFWPHLSTERPPQAISDLVLEIHKTDF